MGGVWTLIYLGGFTKCPSQVLKSDFLDNNLPALFLEKKSLGSEAYINTNTGQVFWETGNLNFICKV